MSSSVLRPSHAREPPGARTPARGHAPSSLARAGATYRDQACRQMTNFVPRTRGSHRVSVNVTYFTCLRPSHAKKTRPLRAQEAPPDVWLRGGQNLRACAKVRAWGCPDGPHPWFLSRVALCMTHMARSSRYDISSHSVMDTAHRSSRPPGGHARRSVLRHDQHASATAPGVQDTRGAGDRPACSHPRCRRQVLAMAAGALAGRLRRDQARRPPLRRTPRRSALPRRVVRAKKLSNIPTKEVAEELGSRL